MNPINTKPSTAFLGELDCKPIYLGYCKRESSYWFYALKDKIPRFLKYINYFHWDRGPQEILEMKPLTEEVEQELQQFLEGKLDYEFRKRRKNSKNSIAFKVYRLPEEVGTTNTKTGRQKPSGFKNPIEHDIRPSGPVDSGGPTLGSSSVRGEDGTDAHGRGRGTRRPRHAKHVEHSAERVVSAIKLEKVIENPPISIASPPVPITKEPRRRGGPRGNKEVLINPAIVSSNLAVVQSEPKNAKPTTPRKSPPVIGLELGVVELLNETPKRKRGRPRKVLT